MKMKGKKSGDKSGYPISEIFDSVQGEGSTMGIPATFIRFAGCNLRCEGCDTKYAWKSGRAIKIDEILRHVKHRTVILTGGEPALYNINPLVRTLKSEGHYVIIETNGTLPVPESVDWIVCSPKPDSNYVIKCRPDELKYVVDDVFNIDVIPEKYLGRIPIWLQPNYFDLKNSLKKCLELVMKNENLRLGIQMHKFYNLK